MNTAMLKNATGASEQEIKDIVRHQYLNIPKGVQGRGREWSRDEAVLIGYFRAARRIGADALQARCIAEFWLSTDDEFEFWGFNGDNPLLNGGLPNGESIASDLACKTAFRVLAEPANSDEWTTDIGVDENPSTVLIVGLAQIRQHVDRTIAQPYDQSLVG